MQHVLLSQKLLRRPGTSVYAAYVSLQDLRRHYLVNNVNSLAQLVEFEVELFLSFPEDAPLIL